MDSNNNTYNKDNINDINLIKLNQEPEIISKDKNQDKESNHLSLSFNNNNNSLNKSGSNKSVKSFESKEAGNLDIYSNEDINDNEEDDEDDEYDLIDSNVISGCEVESENDELYYAKELRNIKNELMSIESKINSFSRDNEYDGSGVYDYGNICDTYPYNCNNISNNNSSSKKNSIDNNAGDSNRDNKKTVKNRIMDFIIITDMSITVKVKECFQAFPKITEKSKILFLYSKLLLNN